MRARWAIELSTYDFVIVHRDGSKHMNADALSRVPAETVNNVQDDTMEDIRVQQQADPDISQLKGWIEQGRKPRASTVKSKGRELRKLYDQYGRCSLRDGVVYRRWKPTNKDEWQWQIVLPKTMRENAIHSLHDESGHFCHTKTLNRVKYRYFWPGMSTDVKDWCTKCVKCQKKRDAVPNFRAPLRPIITTRPRELVTIDLVEYPVSNDGHRYALVVIDNFTKYLELFALNEGTAAAIADKLANEYIPRHGAPEQLHSDQGKNLNAKIVIDVCDILQTCKTRTTPFHPQSDGATERVIRTVNGMLSKVVGENQKDWDEKLPGVMMAYNSAIHESTGFTPYFLEHGREMRLPVDLVATPIPEPGCSQTAFGKKLRTTLENAFQSARESLNTAHRRQKVGYDRWAREKEYRVGDLVWWYDRSTRKGRCQKLNCPWVGPWKIIKQVGDVVYRIQYCGAESVRTRRRIVHHNQIKLCTLPPVNVEGRGNEKDSQGNQNAGLPTPNPVAVDEPRGNLREVAVGDETEGLDAETTEVEDHVSPEAENMTLASENPESVGQLPENSGAENVTEEAANPDTVEQLPETAAGTGTTGSGIVRLTRSGRQSRMQQCPDFEYY